MEQNQNGTVSSAGGGRWGLLVVIIIIVAGGWLLVRNPGTTEYEAEAHIAPDGSLVLETATIPAGGGFIAVYDTTGGTRTLAGQSALLSAGVHENVVVAPEAGRTFEPSRRRSGSSDALYVVVAHTDDGDGIFEPESDAPVVNEDTGEVEEAPVAIDDETEAEETATTTGEADENEETAATSSESVVEDTTDEPGTEDTPVVLVRYTDNGFEPDTSTVAAGQTVRFVNESTGILWVASAIHPTHEELPAFDQNKSVGTGEWYEFTFTEVGNWRYHNHAHASDTGVIVVE